MTWLVLKHPIGELTGSIAATGNYPGKARNAEELRRDLDVVYLLLPGSHRLNLHAIYLESDRPVERNAIEPRHYAAWLDWAKANGHGMDFNPTCFSHSKAAEGFTLSHRDPAIRQFWIEHCIASRKIGDYFGRELGTQAVTNIWIPDGYKDTPADRTGPRRWLMESLDQILAEKLPHNLDAVEPKLFGLGSESYVTGSMEFYAAYAVSASADSEQKELSLSAADAEFANVYRGLADTAMKSEDQGRVKLASPRVLAGHPVCAGYHDSRLKRGN